MKSTFKQIWTLDDICSVLDAALVSFQTAALSMVLHHQLGPMGHVSRRAQQGRVLGFGGELLWLPSQYLYPPAAAMEGWVLFS